MPTLEYAIQIAAKAHSGQVDKGGHPYILHPLRVMLSMDSLSERIAAVLHDVVEDTDLKISDIASKGFTPEVVSAIRALTKRSDESRIEAAYRAASNPIAKAVKIADVLDNMDISRIKNPTKKDIDRVGEYKEVLSILSVDAERYRVLKKYGVFGVEGSAGVYGLRVSIYDGTLDGIGQVADYLIKNEEMESKNVEYDEGYFKTLQDTVDSLKVALTNQLLKDADFYYSADW